MFKLITAICCIGLFGGTAHAQERRCGWFENPTPANIWLTDKDGEWLIGIQGAFQVEGDWPWPDFSDQEWIKTNVHYGYGCACLDVETDKAANRIIKIIRANAEPISTCRNDKMLTEPTTD